MTNVLGRWVSFLFTCFLEPTQQIEGTRSSKISTPCFSKEISQMFLIFLIINIFIWYTNRVFFDDLCV